jgi:hypothetical protein
MQFKVGRAVPNSLWRLKESESDPLTGNGGEKQSLSPRVYSLVIQCLPVGGNFSSSVVLWGSSALFCG